MNGFKENTISHLAKKCINKLEKIRFFFCKLFIKISKSDKLLYKNCVQKLEMCQILLNCIQKKLNSFFMQNVIKIN